MTRQEIAEQAARIGHLFDDIGREDGYNAFLGAHTHATEFFRQFAGPDSEFFTAMKEVSPRYPDLAAKNAVAIMGSFRLFVEQGLHRALTPEHEAQLAVVSDFLDQARQLLTDSSLHPGAAIMLAGATLEEFLRTWAARESVLPAGRPTLSTLAAALRAKSLISKQDEKDVLSWGGLRNSAAHGEWDEVSDRQRAKIMVEGIGLFLRKLSELL